MPRCFVAAAILFFCLANPKWMIGASAAEQLIDGAKQRWADSPHGPMLERILPPTVTAAQLPDPHSRGARLLVRYCVQCHHLPNPAMHDPSRWPRVVERMVKRIDGKGNMGGLMKEMMGDVATPDPAAVGALTAYLRRHAQPPIERSRYPELDTASGQSFRLACQQCHVLPDPRRHTAAEWPAVTARMERNMAWMNRVVGSRPDPHEPQLRIDEINAFLIRYARKN